MHTHKKEITEPLSFEGISWEQLVHFSSLCTPQAQLEGMAQGHVQLGFGSLHRSTTSLGNLIQCSSTLTVKIYFGVQTQPLVFQLCSLSLVPSVNTTKSSALFSLVPTLGIYTHWRNSPWASSSPDWGVPNLSVSPHISVAPSPLLSL